MRRNSLIYKRLELARSLHWDYAEDLRMRSMTTEPLVKGLKMVARNWLMAAVVAAGAVSVTAQRAIAAESAPVTKAPVVVVVAVDKEVLRTEIQGYIRSLNEQMKTNLSEELQRSLPAKIELASNELRARG
jgi:hypothetical protein